jgi:hypothetical protein
VNPEEAGDGPEVLELNDAERSWKVWTWMEATGGRHLPYPGGLMDQPESLMDDLFTISAEAQRMKKANSNG